MKFLFDLHTHSIASGHAYSTLQENVMAAKEAGLEVYGISDHTGPVNAMGDIYFKNLKVIPRTIYGVKVLRGAEVNIVGYNGELDLPESILKRLDYAIASLHMNVGYTIGTAEENTQAYIQAMHNPYVKIIGHPDDSRFPFEIEPVVKAAKETGVLLEVNNSSLKPICGRKGARENIRRMLELCKQYGVRIVVDTDSHISFDVGQFSEAYEILTEMDFPEELIANTSLEHLSWFLNPELIEKL